jgi:hypothetical protein
VFGLFTGETRDVGNGIFSGMQILGNVCGLDLKAEASLREQFTAARRS